MYFEGPPKMAPTLLPIKFFSLIITFMVQAPPLTILMIGASLRLTIV